MSETVNSIVKGALRLLKVKEAGEDLRAEELADGIVAINDILEQWDNERLMQPSLVEITQTLTANDGSYTFGSGGDNATRPQKIEYAFIRDSSGNDFPMERIMDDQYNSINYKTTGTTYPRFYYYRAEYPLATLELYPVPTSAYTLHMSVWSSFTAVSAGSDTVDLAPAYIKALKSNLAVELAPEYKVTETYPLVEARAIRDKEWIKRVNRQDRKTMYDPIRDVVHGGVSGFFLHGRK